LREINIKNKVRLSYLLMIVMLLVLVPVGLGRFTDVAPDAHAQQSSSCDRAVVSLVDCSRSTSSSHSSDDSSSAAGDDDEKNKGDDDEKNNKGDDNDKDNNDEDQKEDKNDGDIESKIPSTAGGGVPFP